MFEKKWILFGLVCLLVLAACSPVQPAGEEELVSPSQTEQSGDRALPVRDEEEPLSTPLDEQSESLADQPGIQGQVLLGPTCPVVQEGESCEDIPYQAVIMIFGADGQEIGNIQTSADGQFQIDLTPGAYTLRPMTFEAAESFENAEESDIPVPLTYPRAEETIVTVVDGEIPQKSARSHCIPPVGGSSSTIYHTLIFKNLASQ